MQCKKKLESILDRLRATTVVTKEANRQRLHVFSRQLMSKFENPIPLFVVVLDGACRFSSDVLCHLENWFPVEIAYVKASSYREVHPEPLRFDSLGLNETRVKGREVVILEDIIDTGLTIKTVSEFILSLDPRSVQIAALINKKCRRIAEPDVCISHVIHPELDGEFYVGYGMDYMNLFRAMNHISVLTDEIRQEVQAAFAAHI